MKNRLALGGALLAAIAIAGCAGSSESAGRPAPAADAAAPAAAPETPGTAPAAATATVDLPQPAVVVPPKPRAGEPHGPGFDMPMIELGGYAPPRPMDILKDAHVFAADHPEVASYVPCYCGCGTMGHKNNADCFVGTRDEAGRVTSWVPHGAACAVCIDIAVESMRMRNSGASVSAIRAQIQNEYRPRFPSSETPTPPPPQSR